MLHGIPGFEPLPTNGFPRKHRVWLSSNHRKKKVHPLETSPPARPDSEPLLCKQSGWLSSSSLIIKKDPRRIFFHYRSDWIRTSGLLVPNQALYRTEPHPDYHSSISQVLNFVNSSVQSFCSPLPLKTKTEPPFDDSVIYAGNRGRHSAE